MIDWGLAGLLVHFAEKMRSKAEKEQLGRGAAQGEDGAEGENPTEGSETDNALQHILDELDPADDDWVELALAVTARAIARPPPALRLLLRPSSTSGGEEGAGVEAPGAQGRSSERGAEGEGEEGAVDEALKLFVARALTLLEDCEYCIPNPTNPPPTASLGCIFLLSLGCTWL